MEKIETFIGLESVKDFLEQESENFSEKQLQEFINHLEIDFYDWLRTNFNSFSLQQKTQ